MRPKEQPKKLADIERTISEVWQHCDHCQEELRSTRNRGFDVSEMAKELKRIEWKRLQLEQMRARLLATVDDEILRPTGT